MSSGMRARRLGSAISRPNWLCDPRPVTYLLWASVPNKIADYVLLVLAFSDRTRSSRNQRLGQLRTPVLIHKLNPCLWNKHML